MKHLPSRISSLGVPRNGSVRREADIYVPPVVRSEDLNRSEQHSEEGSSVVQPSEVEHTESVQSQSMSQSVNMMEHLQSLLAAAEARENQNNQRVGEGQTSEDGAVLDEVEDAGTALNVDDAGAALDEVDDAGVVLDEVNDAVKRK